MTTVNWRIVWLGWTEWSSHPPAICQAAQLCANRLHVSQYRFLSQQCCEQAGKISPILHLQVNVNTTSAVCVWWHSNLFTSLPAAYYDTQWGEQYVCSAEGRVPGVCVWNGHQESLHHHHLWLPDKLYNENWPLPVGWVAPAADTLFKFS